MPKAVLTPKQEIFVAEYLKDLNATKAAVRAGYSERTAQQMGSENLSKPVVAAAIQAGKEARMARVEIDQDWVVEMLRENARRAMQIEPVLDRAGTPTGVFTYEGSVANGALNLLGKHLGMFTEKHEHTFPELTPEDRTTRLSAILLQARERMAATNGKKPQ